MGFSIPETIYAFLDNNAISYTVFNHPAVFTVEEADAIEDAIPGIKAKTLLVFGEKTKKLYLISLEGHKKLEQSKIKLAIGERVRFAQANILSDILHVTPGSVSPLGLLFDTQQCISAYIIDNEIMSSDTVSWHPNINTQTLSFSQEMNQMFLSLLPHRKILY